MKRATLSIVLSVFTLTLLLSLSVTAQNRPEKWEYKVIGCQNESELNKDGDEGWELVAIYSSSGGTCRAYFKRPKNRYYESPPATPPPATCSLSLAQAPVIRGIRLGMTTDELLSLFPRSKEQSEIIKTLGEAGKNYGMADLRFNSDTYPENKTMFGNNVYNYNITLVDGRVVKIMVGYYFQPPENRSPLWTYKTWITKLSETYNLPKPEEWITRVAGAFADIVCQGFRLNVSAQGNEASFSIIALPDIDDQIKQRREAAAEKLRNDFKP